MTTRFATDPKFDVYENLEEFATKLKELRLGAIGYRPEDSHGWAMGCALIEFFAAVREYEAERRGALAALEWTLSGGSTRPLGKGMIQYQIRILRRRA